MSAWVLADSLSFKLSNPLHVLWADRVSNLGIIGAACTVLFVYLFPENGKISKMIYAFLFLPLIPLVILVPTKYYEVIGLPPLCETQTGPAYWITVVLLLYYIVWSLMLIFKKLRVLKDLQRKQFIIFTVGAVLMPVLAIAIDVIPTMLNNGNIVIFTPYITLVFAAFCAYAIVKYKALKAKVMAAQMLTVVTWVLIGSMFFFVAGGLVHLLVALTLTLSVIFGIMLIKSVKLEVEKSEELEIANREINERKEQLQLMADKLSMANDSLRKLDNAKTEFISIASHQLRTPITAVKGFASLLLEGSYGEISESVHGALEKIYASSERLVGLIEDLLNVSRIESGRMQFAFEKSSVEALIKELYDNFILIAKDKKFYLDLKLPENPLPEVVMDYTKIRELVSNFIDNALKYTEKGGVTIKAELKDSGVLIDENGFVIVDQKSQFGRVVRITVSDTGIGIPKEEIPYLFKKFSRGKDVSRLHVGGTGLGLYVGKAIAEAHHGQVWVESDGAGLGSRFIIEIPIEHIA